MKRAGAKPIGHWMKTKRLAVRLRSQPIKNPFEVIRLVGDHDLESPPCWCRKIALMQLAGKALVDSALKDLGKRKNFLYSCRHTPAIPVKGLVAAKDADRGQTSLSDRVLPEGGVSGLVGRMSCQVSDEKGIAGGSNHPSQQEGAFEFTLPIPVKAARQDFGFPGS